MTSAVAIGTMCRNVDARTDLIKTLFGSGFVGVMLSPVHLCLVLTREHFNADLTKVYHRLWRPSALVPLYFAR